MAKSDWFIGMICSIALAIISAVLVCIVKRNRGGKYSVHDKEQRHGGEFDYRDEGGFNDYDNKTYEFLVSQIN
jgi:neuronal cell adhesion protein